MSQHNSARPPSKLTDVARMADVHPGTASRALNPKTRDLVNDETAERVIRAAEQLGYRPNPIARGLKTNRSYTVGVLIPDLTNPLFPPIVRGIQDTLERAGYTPLIANTDNVPEREQAGFAALRARQVDGIITATAALDESDELLALDLPIALVLRTIEDSRIAAARVDDAAGERAAVSHLAALGHRAIAFLGGPESLLTSRDRYKGFVDAMRAAGLQPDPDLIAIGDAFTEEAGARLCSALVASGREFSAILAGNDLIALGCYDVLAEHGMKCPGDISVVGFNDMPFANRFSPPLTTVRVPQYELGVAGAELLLEQLLDSPPAPRQVLMAPELVVRGSTAAV